MCSQWSDKFWMWSACNREKRKSTEFSKTSLEKFVKSNRVNLFLAGFSHLDPLCALTETALQQQWLKMLCFGSNYPRLNLLKKPPDFWHHMGPHSTCLVLEMISSIQVYFPKKVMIERKPVSYSTRYWHSGVEFSTNDNRGLLSYGFPTTYSITNQWIQAFIKWIGIQFWAVLGRRGCREKKSKLP